MRASTPPAGSESFSSTRTEIVRPGLTVILSSTAIGFCGPVLRGAMPRRTVPFARAPIASTTEYWNWSAPAEYSPASYSNQSGPVLTTAPRVGFEYWPSNCTESPSGSTPPRGTGMRTVSPAMTLPVTVAGTGSVFVSGSGSLTEIATVAVANWPAASIRYLASYSPARCGAKYRSRSSETKSRPSSGSSTSSGASVIGMASGCSSFASTGMSMTSPTRAEITSGAATGG